MGLRFRKSIKSGPFRVTLSKSGIGWSVGGKGFRYTKTATGRTRRTYSIPGSGISYVTEKSNKKHTKSPQLKNSSTDSGTRISLLQYPISSCKSEPYDEIANRLNRVLKWNKICNILFILSFLVFFSFYFIIIPVALFLVKFIIYYFGSIQLNYNLNETQARIHNNNIRAWHSLENNQTIRLVISSTYTENNKNNAGVSNNYQRDFMHIIFSLPWFIKSNIPLVQLKLKGGKVIILPNAIMVIVDNQVLINEGSFHIDSDDAQFTEGEGTPLPEGIQIVGYTYLHVKKNGDPDLRYNNNPQYPICLYKQISFSTDFGLSFVALFPNISETEKFINGYSDEAFIGECSCTIDGIKDKNEIISKYFKAVWIPLIILCAVFLIKFVVMVNNGEFTNLGSNQVYQREDYPNPVKRFEIVGNQYFKIQNNAEIKLVSNSDDFYYYSVNDNTDYSIELYAPEKSDLMITLKIKNERADDKTRDNLLKTIIYVIDIDSSDSDVNEIYDKWIKMEPDMFNYYEKDKIFYNKDYSSFDDFGNEYSRYMALKVS